MFVLAYAVIAGIFVCILYAILYGGTMGTGWMQIMIELLHELARGFETKTSDISPLTVVASVYDGHARSSPWIHACL